MKEKIIPIISVLVGIVAFILAHSNQAARDRELEAKKQELYKGATKITVVAAARNIPGGTTIKRSDLGFLEVFKSAVGDRVIEPNEAQTIIGKKTAFSIKKSRAIQWSDLVGASRTTEGLAAIVKSGMRAISLSIGGAQSVSGMIKPNNRIDILGTFNMPSQSGDGQMETVTLTLLQDVTVLACGSRLAKEQAFERSRGNSSYSSVTVEVTPKEAEILVFTQQLKGRLTLALRNPSDMSYQKELPIVNFSALQDSLKELNESRQKKRELRRSGN